MMGLDTPKTCRGWRNILRISWASSWLFFTLLYLNHLLCSCTNYVSGSTQHPRLRCAGNHNLALEVRIFSLNDWTFDVPLSFWVDIWKSGYVIDQVTSKLMSYHYEIFLSNLCSRRRRVPYCLNKYVLKAGKVRLSN